MTISRREFLKIAGVTAASTQLVSLGFALEKPQHGRLLSLTTAHLRPYDNARTTAQLLPDSVHEILDHERGFVRLAAGFVPESQIQPMLEAHFLQPDSLPASIEVIAPYAAVRQFCTAEAPLLARPGHGAVLEAVKGLPDQHNAFGWYQVDLGNGLLGWVQSTQVQQIIETRTLSQTHAVIESH
ncbi:MAG: hypothetical protein K8I82_20260, partial [Anaerolineae bacterium]|nr:hypothetical protein [Anaerolineae bacterium]